MTKPESDSLTPSATDVGVRSALLQLQAIEQAVADQDLVAADAAARRLRPLLVERDVDELMMLRERVKSLQLVVVEQQKATSTQLKALGHQKDGVAAYKTIEAQ